jgi:hypothetical protein
MHSLSNLICFTVKFPETPVSSLHQEINLHGLNDVLHHNELMHQELTNDSRRVDAITRPCMIGPSGLGVLYCCRMQLV